MASYGLIRYIFILMEISNIRCSRYQFQYLIKMVSTFYYPIAHKLLLISSRIKTNSGISEVTNISSVSERLLAIYSRTKPLYWMCFKDYLNLTN